ncbi:MAG: bifunctional riboflavin kinase/FAD synthetase [Ignavibacteriaceae bacterium]|nr:bifunctional riboflavin kinase/FAD synthetase [Ignavibacteriaceae bacterium]
MRIIKDISEIKRDEKSIITLGTFDGLHLGHQQIVDKVIQKSRNTGGRSFLITFDPHPRKIIPGRNDVRLLSTLDEKIMILEQMNLDNLFVINFTPEFSRQSPEEFVEKYLVAGIGLKEIIIGYDHHFGKGRDGNYYILQELGRKFNFAVTLIPEFSVDGEIVSSTKIRNSLLAGDVVKAGKMLGRPYSFTGKIVRGDGRGKKLGFPTANISVDNQDKLIPANGIYAAECIVDNEKHFGLLSIGSRPTFHKDGNIVPEFYIFDFNKDIYERIMQVNMVEKIRDEEKFNSVDELIIQMKKDEEIGKEILSKLIN